MFCPNLLRFLSHVFKLTLTLIDTIAQAGEFSRLVPPREGSFNVRFATPRKVASRGTNRPQSVEVMATVSF